MTLNEYQEKTKRTYPDATRKSIEYHALHGMASEIGELHGIYQKAYQGHTVNREHCEKEVGDLLRFIAEYCYSIGCTLEEIAQKNIDKLMARYPDGFSAERSMHRAEGDI